MKDKILNKINASLKDKVIPGVSLSFMYAGHGINLGGESPLWGRLSRPPTTSQYQGCPS